jgi:hypothetical protein
MKGSTKFCLAVSISLLIVFIKHCFNIEPLFIRENWGWEEFIIIVPTALSLIVNLIIYNIYLDESPEEYYWLFCINVLTDSKNKIEYSEPEWFKIIILLPPNILVCILSYIIYLLDKYV